MEGIEESQCVREDGARAGTSLTTGARVSGGLALAAGLALRILMLNWVFEVNGDSLIYGGIAKSLMLHGRYALTAPDGTMYPTLIRLPGYPFFLAACFRLFGMENYWAAACVQVALELAGCVLLADFARRAARMVRGADAVFARRAGLATLWLAALCPFTAAYCAEPMAESLTVFALALAMWAMARFREEPGWRSALAFTCGVTCATLLRPDGALAAIAFVPVMLMAPRCGSKKDSDSPKGPGAPSIARLFTRWVGNGNANLRFPIVALTCVVLSLTPFAVWTVRNWSVFHVFQPLAPRLATDPGEETNPGWERWVKSWCLDFVSTYQIYWSVPDGPLDVSQLPSRAFDSPAQYAETAALAGDYERQEEQLTPAIDAAFARLAAERIRAHPFRYYVLLPLGRVADMWLRPRVENLNIDLDWWVYAHHHDETIFSWFYAALNALYLLLAAIGLWLRPRDSTPGTKTRLWGPRLWKALLAYMLLRSALLLTVEAPEARYTLECFPMLFALGGVAVAAGLRKIHIAAATR